MGSDANVLDFTGEDFTSVVPSEEPDAEGRLTFGPNEFQETDYDLPQHRAKPTIKDEVKKEDVLSGPARIDPLALPKAVTDAVGWDVDYPDWDFTVGTYSPGVAALMAGWGHGMTDISRGVKQLLDLEVEENKKDQEIMRDLYDDPEFGKLATGGQVVGLITEPIGFLYPAAKAKSGGRALMYGMSTGTILGGLGYVDEEAGGTRLGNAVTGSVLGGAFGLGIQRAGKYLSHKKVKKAASDMRKLEVEFANLILEGNTQREAIDVIKSTYPHLLEKAQEGSALLKQKIHFPGGQKAAERTVRYYDGLDKTQEGWSLDKMFGILHTRIKNISPDVAHSIRKLEFNIHTRAKQYLDKAAPFARVYDKLSTDAARIVNQALINGDFEVAKRELHKCAGQEGLDAFKAAKEVFDELGNELEGYGVIEKNVKNYWHRSVKNLEGLLEATGSTSKEAKDLAYQIKHKNRSLIKDRGYEMTPHEQAVFVQGHLKNDRQLKKIGYASEREIGIVSDKLMPYYANPKESLESFIRNAVWDTEQAKFFGPKNLKISSESHMFDPTLSINSWARHNEAIKNLDQYQVDELKGLLKARFGAGQQPMWDWLNKMKAFSYSALLGNPLSAATQLSDIANAAYRNGVRNALRATYKTITGSTDVKVKDFGLSDALIQEFADVNQPHRKLNFFMKASGFNAIDRLGKSAVVNSALDKFTKASMNVDSKAYRQFAEKYRKAWGKDFFKLTKELKQYGQSGDVADLTDDIRFLLWNELSDIQPISLSEMPEYYLTMPNGKIVYMLKSFLLKQYDLMRNDAYKQIKSGNVAKGFWNLTKYATLMGGANMGTDMIKEMMVGKEVDIESIEDAPGEWLASVFKTFGFSEYFGIQVEKSGPMRALMEWFIPPMAKQMDDLFWSSWSVEKGEVYPEKVIQHVPLVGKPIKEITE